MSFQPRKKDMRIITIVEICLILILATGAMGRTPVPPPAGGGSGSASFAPDQELVFNPASNSDNQVRNYPEMFPVPNNDRQAKFDRSGMAGGDDVSILPTNAAYGIDLAIAANGDYYCLAFMGDEPYDYAFTLQRSTDSGTTWETWATFSDPDLDVHYGSPSLHIAEGDENRIYLAYRWSDGTNWNSRVDVAWSPLTETSDFTIVTVHEQDFWAGEVSITSDALAYSHFYLYLVYGSSEENPSEIRFTRSTNFGETWEESYAIGTLTNTDRDYRHPKIAYGYGGYVHVTWTFMTDDDNYSSALRYRRVPGWGNGGLANWDPIINLSSINDSAHKFSRAIAASQFNNQVLVGCDRYQDSVNLDSHIVLSENQGENFGPTISIGEDIRYLRDIDQHLITGNWLLSGTRYLQAGYVWATEADPTDWNSHISLADTYNTYSTGLVVDATHDHQVAMCFVSRLSDSTYDFKFDAQWRSDDGFPNYESNFPVDLVFSPISDPAVVDINGDGYQEIIFGDSSGRIQVFTSYGTSLPGWPVDTEHPLSTFPIAVGDLNGDGQVTILAGTEDGWVYGINPDGTTAMGWPFNTGEGEPASVIIGNLGPPYHRTAVVTCGTEMQFLNYRATNVIGTPVWQNFINGFGSAPAIGDIDGDGINEVVFTMASLVLAAEQTAEVTELYRSISGNIISAAPTLGDFDLDGDVEIVVTTTNGTVYLINDDGSNFPGDWPFVTSNGSALSSAAIASCRGSSEPEIVVCSKNFAVDLIYNHGGAGSGFPANSDGWYIYGSPLIGGVEGPSPDIVAGARGNKGWAWDNFGTLIEGWPKTLSNHCELTPAMGDIDLDGRNEIVFLTRDQLAVVDVGTAPSSDTGTWAMAGHNPQRTGCSNCPEDMVSAVDNNDVDHVTRISFAAPSPNPISDQTVFRYSVPVRAVAELAIYDLRGHRISLVSRQENEAGHYSISWNGKDAQGRMLASGNYIASLRVRGPGLTRELSRKITILR